MVSPIPNSEKLKLTLVHGIKWNVIGSVFKHVSIITTTVVFARYLNPSEYAIAGLGITVLGFFTIISAQGYAEAIIQRSDLNLQMTHTIFWFSFLLGIIAMLIMFFASNFFSFFYKNPELSMLIKTLSVVVLTLQIGTVPKALLRRQLKFKIISILEMLCRFTGAIVGISMVYFGFGVWSIIASLLMTEFSLTLLSFVIARYTPVFTFSWSELKQASQFGLTMMGSSVILYINDNADYIIFGRFWNPFSLGQYYFAFERARQPYDFVFNQLSSVVYPALSSFRKEGQYFKEFYLQGTKNIALFVFPLHVLMIALADPLIVLIFGDQWKPAIPVFQVFAIFGFVRTFTALASSIYMALNKTYILLWYNLFRLFPSLVAISILAYMEASILSSSIILMLLWSFQTPFYLIVLLKQTGLTFRELSRRFIRMVASSVLMFFSIIFSKEIFENFEFNQWVVIVFSGCVGLSVFLYVSWHHISELVEFLAKYINYKSQTDTK